MYLSGALILNNIGFAIVGAILSIWAVFLLIYIWLSSRITNTPLFYLFFMLYTVYVVVAFSFWRIAYDFKDIIATYLFFVFIPLIVINLNYTYTSFKRGLIAGIKVFFIIFSVAVFVHAFVFGIDWERSSFFGLEIFHKNGVSAFYEILFIFILFRNSRSFKLSVLLTILVGFTCLIIIGSKTTIALALLFTIGFYSRSLFKFSGLLLLCILIYLIFFISDLDTSPFRTASYRALLWEQAWQEIRATKTTLILGNGPGTFIAKIRAYELYGIEGAHNYIVQLAHNYGFLGLSVFFYFFRKLWQNFKIFDSPASVAFWMFNMHALFDVGWVKGAGFFASIFLGLAYIHAIDKNTAASQQTEVF